MRTFTHPILFLDFDDVIVVGGPYGGYDVLAPGRPDDLFQRLFHGPAVEVLLRLLVAYGPSIVPTSSWTRFMERDVLTEALEVSGLCLVERLIHPSWRFHQPTGMTRAQAIKEWLDAEHAGEPFAILDDSYSGTGLQGSAFDTDGRVALCEVGVGLTATQEAIVAAALERPFTQRRG